MPAAVAHVSGLAERHLTCSNQPSFHVVAAAETQCSSRVCSYLEHSCTTKLQHLSCPLLQHMSRPLLQQSPITMLVLGAGPAKRCCLQHCLGSLAGCEAAARVLEPGGRHARAWAAHRCSKLQRPGHAARCSRPVRTGIESCTGETV